MFASAGSRFAAWFGGTALMVILVLGAVAMLSSPSDSVTLSRGGAQVLGYGGGSFKAGVVEIPAAYRVTAGAKSANQLPSAGTASSNFAKQNAALKRQLAQQKKDIAALKKAQSSK